MNYERAERKLSNNFDIGLTPQNYNLAPTPFNQLLHEQIKSSFADRKNIPSPDRFQIPVQNAAQEKLRT
jgi:hypothetical protein